MSDPSVEDLEVTAVPTGESEIVRTNREISEIDALCRELVQSGIGSRRIASKDGTLSIDIMLGLNNLRPVKFDRHGSIQQLRELADKGGYNKTVSVTDRDTALVIDHSTYIGRNQITEYANPSLNSAVFVVNKDGQESVFWLGRRTPTERQDLWPVRPVKEARIKGEVGGRSERLSHSILYYNRESDETVIPEHFQAIGEPSGDTKNLRLDSLSNVTPNIKAALQAVKASSTPTATAR